MSELIIFPSLLNFPILINALVKYFLGFLPNNRIAALVNLLSCIRFNFSNSSCNWISFLIKGNLSEAKFLNILIVSNDKSFRFAELRRYSSQLDLDLAIKNLKSSFPCNS